jgi:hypothetical protein
MIASKSPPVCAATKRGKSIASMVIATPMLRSCSWMSTAMRSRTRLVEGTITVNASARPSRRRTPSAPRSVQPNESSSASAAVRSKGSGVTVVSAVACARTNGPSAGRASESKIARTTSPRSTASVSARRRARSAKSGCGRSASPATRALNARNP